MYVCMCVCVCQAVRASRVSLVGRVPITKTSLLLKDHGFNSLDTLVVRLLG